MAKKYYFGYYGLNGLVCYMKWEEIGGTAAEGAPKVLGDNRYEITRREFVHRRLKNLSVKHPYKEMEGLQ